ncbi:hypothetical protein NC653_023167 [Populus alba x Populus x berolinensis]|uniref:Disease resistance N-terminal domain-containing protein n=1 Tax=Populus alba x Populus x berolinensis TaxID=444605 RepID=A0AAD6MGG6_9ROSI|nr:hypothetical protein NC653_023167 [Populus alba x Populus x berolinensis]
MAGQVLSPALQVIFDRIASPFIEVLGEEQQVTRKAVKIWLPNLRDAAYVTEDLLEHLTVEGKQYPVPISINAWKVRKALEALETTAYEGLGLNLREDIVINSKYNTRETSSFTVGMEVYGRAEDSTTVIIL